jgi:hypothetical protein
MMCLMTKSLSYDLTYDAPIDAVMEMLLDPAFREAVCDAQHAVSRKVESAPPVMHVEYTQQVRGIPSFAAGFVGDTINVVQDESWSGRSAKVTIQIPGKPGSASGTFTVAERGGRTVESARLDVTVKMPLVGGRLESLVADLFLKALQREERTGREWLAR